MARNRIIAMIAAAAMFVMCWAVAAGDASDPVVSKSYLENTLSPAMLNGLADRVSSKLSDPSHRIDKLYSDAASKISTSGIMSAAADIALEELQARDMYWYYGDKKTVEIKAGQVLCGDTGTRAMVLEGSGEIFGNTMVEATGGYEYPVGSRVLVNSTYFFVANNGAGLRFTTDAKVILDGRYKLLSAVRVPRYTDLAEALKAMGLVKGAGNGFELYRSATRAESVTMLLRLLAEEDDADAAGLTHSFTDVRPWADNIVAYALERGYTKGISKDRFGAVSPVTASQYMTFLLRALGYNDSAGDFTWDKSMEAALDLGIITDSEYTMISTTPFTRDHMMYLSYYVLSADIKGTEVTLLENLVAKGAVDRAKADAAMASVSRVRK